MVALPPDLKPFAREYRALERDVQRLIRSAPTNCCPGCRVICCREDICDETCQSHWLGANLQVAGSRRRPPYPSPGGWLSATGCVLQTGRPPVCYSFFCEATTDDLSAAAHYALQTAGRLLEWVGRRALGPRHLVELTEPEDLWRIRPERLIVRIAPARQALAVCEAVLLRGAVPEGESLAALWRIAPPPASLRRQPGGAALFPGP